MSNAANQEVGFDETEVTDRLPKARAGDEPTTYTAEVVKLRYFYSKNQGGNVFIPEFKIAEAPPGAEMSVGEEFADPHFHFGPNREMFYRLTKKLLGAITGERPSQIKLADLEECSTDDQPCARERVRVTVSPQISKKKNTFAKCEYETYRAPKAA